MAGVGGVSIETAVAAALTGVVVAAHGSMSTGVAATGGGVGLAMEERGAFGGGAASSCDAEASATGGAATGGAATVAAATAGAGRESRIACCVASRICAIACNGK